MSEPSHRFDAVTPEELVARGSMKWTRFPGTLPAWVAEMDFPVASVITDALAQSTRVEQFGYLPPALKSELQQTTADFLQRYDGWSVDPERVYPTGDVLTAYEHVLNRLIPAGSPIVLPTPAYMPFISLAKLFDHPVIEVPLLDLEGDRPRLDLAAIDEALAGEAELVVLCNPHNPLGIVHTESELQDLAEVVERRGGMVFADEIHAPLVFNDHRHVPYASSSPEAAQHSLTATSASKAWNLPGLKCAQMVITSDAHLATLEPFAMTITHSAANPGIVATIAAYREGGAWLAEAREYLEGNLDLIEEFCRDHLPGAHFRRPQGSYITWLDARAVNIGSAESPAEFFRETAHVALTDGASCGEAGIGHLRMIAATPRPVLQTLLERLDAHWELRS